MMNEQQFQRKVRLWLNDHGFKACKYQASIYSQAGVSDLLACSPRGKFVALEIKATKNSKRRPLQAKFIEDINSRGGFAAFVYPENWEEIKETLQKTLTR